jgi:hypothetical protein
MGNAQARSQYGNVNMTDISMHNVELSGAQVTALQTLGSASGNEVQRFPITESVGTISGQITDIVNNQKATLRKMTIGFRNSSRCAMMTKYAVIHIELFNRLEVDGVYSIIDEREKYVLIEYTN